MIFDRYHHDILVDPTPLHMYTIASSEIRRHRSYDQKGYVFRWRHQIYRAIYPNFEEDVRELWSCGLVETLIQAGLIPNSEITEYKTHDCNLVILHERVPVETIPSEWSFTMLRDAALVTLRVNRIARRHGYQTMDAHGFNILFHGSRALFIDLGSFVKIRNDFGCKNPGWRPYGEFTRSFYAPLKLWSRGSEYIARCALLGEQLPMWEYWRHRWPLLRLVPVRYLKQYEVLYYRYKGLNTIATEEFRRFVSVSSFRQRFGELVIRFAKVRLLFFSSINLERLERRVAKLKPPRVTSVWADYYSAFQWDDRFSHILNVITKYGPRTILDMGGNAGFLTKRIIVNTEVSHAICADYDQNAIDILYNSLEHHESRLYPVVLNFSISIADTKFPDSHERLKSEMVIALAVTHHLLLSQGLTLDFIFHRLEQYSERYVLVEFMPLGLYSSDYGQIPLLPSWYNLDWFRQGLKKHFILLDEKTLDKNRVLFVAEKKTHEDHIPSA